MAIHEPTSTRRQALAGLAFTAALGAVPVSALAEGFSSRAAWNTAVARVRATTEAVKRTGAHCSAAHAEAEAACPPNNEFFERYNVHHGVSREQNVRQAQISILLDHCYGRAPTVQEHRQIFADANRVVDDFEAYCAKRDEAYRDYDECQEQFDNAADAQHDAREALLYLPAPDHAALLEKIDLLALIMQEMAVEDAERMAAVKADAHRLLNAGRA